MTVSIFGCITDTAILSIKLTFHLLSRSQISDTIVVNMFINRKTFTK